MANNIQKLWSCVGSAGVVDVADVGKIIFNNSIAQLGPAGPIVVDPLPERAIGRIRPGTETVTATIRFGVVPVDGVYVPTDGSLGLALLLRYRDGAGHVSAKLIQVNISSGTELPVLSFDSGTTSNNHFQVRNSPTSGIPLDFVKNAYYVDLTLKLIEGLVAPSFPPAVSVVQLALLPPTIE